MMVDLHSHFFPTRVAAATSRAPVEVGRGPNGALRLAVLGHDFLVPARLGDPQAQAAAAEEKGMDGRALMLPPFTILYELDAGDGVDWCRRLNEAIAQAAADRPRLVGFATVPLQSGGDRAARELAYAVTELGLSGVEILTSVCGRGLDAPELDQFWAAAERLSVPVFVHPHYVAGADRMGQYHLRNVIGNPTETALAGARLVYSGILSRYPGLKVILSHGGGALPHLIGRMRHAFEARPEFRDGAAPPADSLSKLFYDTVVFDPTVLRHVGELVGLDRLVLGSDFPFDMAEDDPVGFVAGSGLPAASITPILHAADRLLPAG
jgi:aminocarboxymuconate-semialdehyde decarboxylase